MREFGCEHPVRHCLTALDQTRFIGAIVRFGSVQRVELVPHQHIALVPVMRILESGPPLMPEQEIQQSIAFLLVHAINADRVARPSRRGTFNAYNTLTKAMVLLNDISVCQS